MRVGFVSDAREIGGSEVWLATMLPLLKARGLSPYVALPEGADLGPIPTRLEAAGIPVHRYREPKAIPEAGAYLVSTWFPHNLRRLLAKLKPPRIALVHDQVEIFYPLGLHLAYRLGYRLLQAPLLRQADGVITVSAWAARWLREVHRVPRVYATKNGVDASRFFPAASREEKARLKADFGVEGPLVLHVGRFSPSLEKNQLAALLAAKGLPLTLAFAGDGPTRGPLMALAQALGARNVRFLGRVAEMPRLYRAADLFFFPTLGENQSLATLEAMASGLPVLTSPIPAQAELVEDGIRGRLVPPRPRALRRALKDFLAHPETWARWGENARAYVEKTHTLEDSADAFMAALGKALKTWRMTGSSSAAA